MKSLPLHAPADPARAGAPCLVFVAKVAGRVDEQLDEQRMHPGDSHREYLSGPWPADPARYLTASC